MPSDELPSIDFIIADLDAFTRSEIVALAINVDAELRENPPLGTPVDTGWARANWVPSVGEPVTLDAKKNDPSPGDVAARIARAEEGRNAVLSWKPADGAIFVTNNVPYIQRLNDGSSTQSPAGFVQAGLERAVNATYSAGRAKAQRNRRAAAARAKKARPR